MTHGNGHAREDAEPQGSRSTFAKDGTSNRAADANESRIPQEGAAVHPLPAPDHTLRCGGTRSVGEGERPEAVPSAKRKRRSSVESETLLTEDAIIAMSLPLRRRAFCGVYFLIRGDDIVYVGASTQILRRLSVHLVAEKMLFNRIAFILCDKAEVWEIEFAYISALDPIYNRIGGPDADGYRRLTCQRERVPLNDYAAVLTSEEATIYLEQKGIHLADSTLTGLRRRRKGPVYYTVPRGGVVYYRHDLDAWAKNRMLSRKVVAA